MKYFKQQERSLKCFGDVSGRFSDPLSLFFVALFVLDSTFSGGNFVLQTCRPNMLSGCHLKPVTLKPVAFSAFSAFSAFLFPHFPRFPRFCSVQSPQTLVFLG